MGEKITFVIGAGASVDFGFPLGSGLKRLLFDEMKKFLNRRTVTPTLLTQYINSMCQKSSPIDRAQQITAYESAARRVMTAIDGFDSIDAMLRVHVHDEEVVRLAKLAITIIIADYERKALEALGLQNKSSAVQFINLGSGPEYPTEFSPVYHRDKAFELVHSITCWTNELVRLLNSLGSTAAVEKALESCTFIIFNYDRCAEFYLACSLQASHLMDAARAWEVVKKAKFIHPYGSIGDLPPIGGEYHHNFGDELRLNELTQISSSLRTFSEGVSDTALQSEIHQAVLGANSLIFLGFGFLEMNMDLLLGAEISNGHPSSRYVLASANYVTESDLEAITGTLTGHKLRANPLQTENKSCVELMQAYKMRLKQLLEEASRS